MPHGFGLFAALIVPMGNACEVALVGGGTVPMIAPGPL